MAMWFSCRPHRQYYRNLSQSLYGITCAQTLYYMRRYSLDRIWLKLFLKGASFHPDVDSCIHGYILGASWYVINKSTLTNFSLTCPLKADFFLEGVTILIVQMYFIYCIWKVVEHRQYQLLLTMTVDLRSEKNSNIAVAIQNAAEENRVSQFLGTLHASPFELIWLAFHYPGSKLYVNSLFALLNMRDYFKSDRLGGYVGDNVLLSINQGGQAGYRQNSYAMQVQVETTTTAETH
ncbi:predicted protein [Postia placenta Mad-698-R]|nr:predicted protein [Postia placenta Mad-698-R]